MFNHSPYLVDPHERGVNKSAKFNVDLLDHPRFIPNQGFIPKEEIDRAEKLLGKDVWQGDDESFINELLPKLEFWNGYIFEYFKEELTRTGFRSISNVDYQRQFMEQDWPTCRLAHNLKQRCNCAKSTDTERVYISTLIRRVLDGLEIDIPGIAQKAKLSKADGNAIATVQFEGGALNEHQVILNFDPSTGSINFDTEALPVSKTRRAPQLTGPDIFLMASMAEPTAIRNLVSNYVIQLMGDVHVNDLDQHDWQKMNHVSGKDFPFVMPSNRPISAQKSYEQRLNESGATNLTSASTGVLSSGYYDVNPIRVVSVRDMRDIPQSGKLFLQRHEPMYRNIVKQMSDIFGYRSLLEQSLDCPATNPDELSGRQELFQTVEVFMNSPEAEILLNFFNRIVNMLTTTVLMTSGMQEPLPSSDKAIIQAIVELDFGQALAPILELRNPLFGQLARNLLKNSEKLKTAWRKILAEPDTKSLGDIFNDLNFPFVDAFSPIFDFYPFKVLAGELSRYKKRFEGSSFANLQPSDDISLKGVMPIIIQQKPAFTIICPDPHVPLDLDIQKTTRIFILRGPNMGGKSTVLRTLALTKQLGQAGLPIPVNSPNAHIKMPIGGGIDSTQRQEDRPGEASTFQAQITRLYDLLNINPDVVTMDEYGLASTQGAQFLLDEIVLELANRGTFVVIAVQDKSDIERLEELIASRPGDATLKHAHMAYSTHKDGAETRMTPTYRVADGRPSDEIEGMPFVVAKNLMPGMDDLVERAEKRYLKQ